MPERLEVDNLAVFRAFALSLGFGKLKAKGAYLRNRANNKRQCTLLLRCGWNNLQNATEKRLKMKARSCSTCDIVSS
jgi:hypothetical protein